jgi:endogenous inhibitor of DNA gyrase (YacG/DUF329 family)
MRYIEAECFECGELISQSSKNRQFCSGRCRGANFRRIQKEKLNILEKLLLEKVPDSPAIKRDLFEAA